MRKEVITKTRLLILILDTLRTKIAYDIGHPDRIGRTCSFEVNKKTTL